jgi:hypothetical protein
MQPRSIERWEQEKGKCCARLAKPLVCRADLRGGCVPTAALARHGFCGGCAAVFGVHIVGNDGRE